MTKRAKLSLDPVSRAKGEPPHGFKPGAGTADTDAGHAPVRPGASKPRSAAGAWQADRPKVPDGDAAGAPTANRSAFESPAQTLPLGLPPQLAALAKHPLARTLALGAAAGLSFYLLKRRL
jgi:hypothetical protein